jgi:hypothetical protein
MDSSRAGMMNTKYIGSKIIVVVPPGGRDRARRRRTPHNNAASDFLLHESPTRVAL